MTTRTPRDRAAPRRTALITGAAAGIGAAAAGRFLEEGYRVIAVDRDKAALAVMPGLVTVEADVTDPVAVQRLHDTAAALGPLHVLVNGVGSNCAGSIAALDVAAWRSGFELNLTSMFLVTRALLPLLRAAQGDRVIVNISSTLARVADPDTIAYGAFKAALEQFTRALALDLAGQGIRAVAVAPGPVAATAAEERWPEGIYGRLNPAGRFAAPDEVARVIAFLASPESAYLTGGIYSVDGGDSALGLGWGAATRLLPYRPYSGDDRPLPPG